MILICRLIEGYGSGCPKRRRRHFEARQLVVASRGILNQLTESVCSWVLLMLVWWCQVSHHFISLPDFDSRKLQFELRLIRRDRENDRDDRTEYVMQECCIVVGGHPMVGSCGGPPWLLNNPHFWNQVAGCRENTFDAISQILQCRLTRTCMRWC